MKKFLLLALVSASGLVASAPAQAGPLDGIVSALSSVQNMGSTASYGCSGSGLSQLACQANRVNSIGSQLRYQSQDLAQRQRDAYYRQQNINEALVRACQAGDQRSCERAGPAVDPQTQKVVNALNSACSAGDQDSCQRVSEYRQQVMAYRR